jgi:sortase A
MSDDKAGIDGQGARRSFSRIEKVILVVTGLLIITAAVLFLWEPVMNKLRNNETNRIVDKIVSGEQTIIVKRDALPVNGEGYEAFDDPEEVFEGPSESTSQILDPLPEDVVLTALGTITIDKIDLFLPLLDGAGVVPLRYGAGRLEGTATPGAVGNCVILGHRMKDFGSIFNRLDEVAVGDIILFTDLENKEMTFIVDEVYPKLEPAELGNYLSIDSGSGRQITLITCTPTGIGTHRIVIVAHLQETS